MKFFNYDGMPASKTTYDGVTPFDVAAGTNAYRCRDCDTFIRLHTEDPVMSVAIDGNEHEEINDVVINLRGECELDALIDGLRFMADTLETIRDVTRLNL